MILWWGKKKDKDPKTGETPVEPLEPPQGAPEAPAEPDATAEKKPILGGLFGGGKDAEIVPDPEPNPAEPSPVEQVPAEAAPTPAPEPAIDPFADDAAAEGPPPGPTPPKIEDAPPPAAPEPPTIEAAAPDASAPVEAPPPVETPRDPVVAAPPTDPVTDPVAETKSPGFFSKLTRGLQRSSSKLADGISGVFTKRKLDDDALEELEDLLISSDLGAGVAARVTAAVAKDRFDKDVTDEEIKTALAEEITAVLKPREEIVDFSEGPTPRIVLFVGVNGSGKTTTIGKIASKLSAQGADILLAAGDTFRAAAVEQLKVWSERAGASFLSRPQGADSAGLAYDAVAQAKSEGRDLVLIDTAGRLQNRAELMDELAKVIRAIRKIDPDAPHDVILVLDATVGQNALSQVDAFRHTAGVTGLVMTKLDGTAKGGVLVAIADKYDLPIHFVGVGEKAEDLHPFSAEAFAKALVGLEETVA